MVKASKARKNEALRRPERVSCGLQRAGLEDAIWPRLALRAVRHECRFGPTDVLGGDLKLFHCSIEDLLTLPESFQRKTHLYHYADDTFDDDPLKPNYDIGKYRLLVQNKTLKLL
ncbi:hypothetical protein [Hoeflea sp.]|uniref:hypothetical protein n=1 Tax=Hoeflea sp. TaxID=1940281 RepID=UPI003A91FCA8